MLKEQKLHKNLVEAVVKTLYDIFNDQKYADKAIEKTLLSNKKWGARDRGFIAENTYEMVRWWRLITEVGEIKSNSLSDLWKAFGTWWLYSGNTLPAWDEFNNINKNKISYNFEKIKTERKIIQSIPDWMDELGTKELGERWGQELESLNSPADVVIRTNTLKISRSELKRILETEGIELKEIKGYNDALVLLRRQNIFTTKSFKEGFFEVQDASSQLVASSLDLSPGMRVIDACAGAGGKTLHIASLLKNKGRIIALDTEEWKLNNLRKRASRSGASIIETKVIESSKTIKRLSDSADRLLLDVPCSGLGVLKRNPDAKWKLTEEFIKEIKNTQKSILQSYSFMLKVNGKMIYSTCSILPSENNKQVEEFLREQNGKFELISEKKIFPSEGFDGFYIALLERKK